MGLWPNASTSWQTIRFRISIPKERIAQTPNGTDLSASNLLSVQGDAIQPLDQQTEEVVYEVVTEYPGISNASYFFFFDLPVAYDPCICENDVAIVMEASVENERDVKIKGTLDATVIQEGTTGSTGFSSLVTKRIIGGAAATVISIASGGTILNTGAFTELLDIFSQRPQISSETQNSLEFLQGTLDNVADLVYDSEANKWRNIVTNETMENSDYNKLLSGMGAFLDEGFDFGDPSSSASKVRSTINGSITASGTAVLNAPSGDIIYLGVPGSNWSNNLSEVVEVTSSGLSPEYTIYNNPLGTFSLLKTPKLKVKTDELDLCVNAVYNNDSGEFEYGRLPRTIFTLFFDNEELKYFINPILNLNPDRTNIKASIVVKSTSGGFQESFYGDENGELCIASQHGQNEFEIHRGTNIYSSVDKNERLSYPVDLDYLNDMVVIFTGDQANLTRLDYEFYLRLNILGESYDLGRDGSPNKLNQILSFPLEAELYEGTPLPWPQTQIDLDDIPVSTVDLQNYFTTYNPYNTPIVFQSNQPEPYQPGNEAWHKEFVNVSTQLSSPTELSTISSEVGIKLETGAIISPGIKFKVGVPLAGNTPQSEATSTYVSDFCQNNITNNPYQANQFSATAPISPLPNQEFLSHSYQEERIQSSISISPNPANDLVILKSSNANISSISLFDLSGRVLLEERVQNNSRIAEINLQYINTGTYIVQVKCDEQVFSEKLIVTK